MTQVGGKLYQPSCDAVNTEKPKYNNFCALMIAALVFLPLSTTGNLIRLAAAVILFVATLLNKKMTYEKDTLILINIMILSVIVPYIAVLLTEGGTDYSAFLHEFQRICFNSLLILIVVNCRISFRTVYRICLFILLCNLAIQVLQWSGVTAVSEFLINHYLQSTESTVHIDLALNTGFDFRSGSIFLNPNVYMVIPLTSLCVFLQAQILRRQFIHYVWVAAALFSLILTGSRTALVVAIVIICVYFAKYDKRDFIKWILLMLILAVFSLYGQYFTANYRIFSISSGLNDSLSVKWAGFLGYLRTAKPLYFLTGSLSSPSVNIMMDSEWGYIFSYFGPLGIWWYIGFLKMILKNRAVLPFQSVTALIVICFVAMTASVVLCMPIFSFFCLIVLAKTDTKTYEAHP